MEMVYFAKDTNNVRNKMIDFTNHYFADMKKNHGVYDTSHTLEEKNKAIHEIMMSEIKTISGVDVNSSTLTPAMLAANPNIQWASMAVINALVDFVLPDVLIKDTGLYADVVTGDFGSSWSFDIKPNDIFTVSKAGRNQRITEVQRAFDSTVTIVPDNHQITIGCNLYRILCGYDSMADLAMRAIIAIDASMRVEAYNLLNTTLTALDATDTNGSLKVAGFTKNSAIALAQRVGAWNGGKAPMFAGTKAALSQITADTATFRYDENSDLFKLGYFRNYAGYDVFEMEQVAKWEAKYKLMLDDKKIFLISPAAQKLMKICYEGTQITNASDAFAYANNTQTMSFGKSWGMGMATNSVAGVIVLA